MFLNIFFFFLMNFFFFYHQVLRKILYLPESPDEGKICVMRLTDIEGWDWYKKNELRHSRGAPHTNHIINNTKTNNRVQRYSFAALPATL